MINKLYYLFFLFIYLTDASTINGTECKATSSSNIPNGFINEISILTDDHKSNLQLTWISKDNKKMLLVISDILDSSVYLCDLNKSYNFTNINDHINNTAPLKEQFMLVKHPSNNSIVYLVSMQQISTEILISFDEGNTFKRISLKFKISAIIFNSFMNTHLLVLDELDHVLYFSDDYGITWKIISKDIIRAKWNTDPNNPEQIFVIQNHGSNKYIFGLYALMKTEDNVLLRSDDFGQTWKDIKKYVYSFGLEEQFIFASVFANPGKDDDRRVLHVSSNSGDNWNQVKLPEITQDKFYSILDMSEGMIFLHVDDAGDTGRGTIYTSDATGILFSVSLKGHLYPNFEQVTDFYKVESMRGVFITSILALDDSVQTRISFNRGAEWDSIPKPLDQECEDHSTTCHLHIHNLYSIEMGVKSLPPKSVSSAPGIILVHGNVADSLQSDSSNVYVSSDGGHTWRFSLKGPHHYVIADSGGFFVAVPAFVETVYSIKFSTDEGRCWEEFNFTAPGRFVFKDLLVEPSSKDIIVAVWGYTISTNIWMTYIINASQIITRKCEDGDYETWTPTTHQQNGCLLGVKETFRRIKPDSLCYNGIVKEIAAEKQYCTCTMDDYYCDYGYIRKEEDCVKDFRSNLPNVDICYRNHKERIVFLGYHKIPGDECIGKPTNGFTSRQTLNLSELCEDDKAYLLPTPMDIKKLNEAKVKETKKNSQVVFGILALAGVSLLAIILTIIARKYKVFRKRTIRYQSIQSGDIVNDNNNQGNYYDSDDGLGYASYPEVLIEPKKKKVPTATLR